VNSVSDLLRALHGGFQLVTIFYGIKTSPSWRLMKDGQYSAPASVNGTVAHIVAGQYCLPEMKLEDGSLLYPLNPNAPERKRMGGRPRKVKL
jgi:hypothetical protein